MDGYPVEDRKYKADALVQTGGGPAANAASLAAQWGARSAYAGLLGDDPYGRLILQELSISGVDTSLTQLSRSCSTPISAVFVNKTNGSRTLINSRKEHEQPAVTDEIISKLKGMKPSILHFDGHAPDLSLRMTELFPGAQVVIDGGNIP